MYGALVFLTRETLKIRIGYVLISADIRTLFSRRNSENSLTPAHTSAHPHTSMHIYAHKHLPTQAHTCKNLYEPMHTCAHLHMLTHACAFPRIPRHTCTHPTNTHLSLNLITHMKLHVNRTNTKKTRKEGEEDRKKEGT